MFGIQKIAGMFGIGFALLLWTSGRALGQSEDARPESPQADSASRAVQQVGPTIIFLRDKKGELHPSPAMTLEELTELARLREREADAVKPPQFHFTDADITGTGDDGKVSLQADYGIVVHSDRWVRIPIGLGGAADVRAEFSGSGEHFIKYDEERQTYVAWIRPDASGETHRMKLNLLAKVAVLGNERRLSLRLPRVLNARDAPKMVMRVAAPNATAVATSGGQECQIETKQLGRQTELRITQPGGEFTLAWRTRTQQPASPVPAAFDAVANTIVTWDSQSRIVWESSINVQVLRGTVQRLKVTLPPATTILALDVPGQRVLASEPGGDEGGPAAGDRPRATVEFDQPLADGAHEVKLAYQRVVDPRKAKPSPLEIGGLEVEGAVRQSGFIGVIPSRSWRASIVTGEHVYRQYEMPPGFREAGVKGTNTFEFFSQPHSLKMSVTPRERKIESAPHHELNVSARRLSLDSHVRYRVSGTQIDACRMIFPGWEVSTIHLFVGDQREAIEFDPPTESTLDVPLPRTMRGDFELQVEAFQLLTAGSDFFVVNLPSVEADEVSGATIAVTSASALQLEFDENRSTGVTARDAPVSSAESPPDAMLFDIANDPTATIAADILVRPRRVEVSSAAEISISNSLMSVAQILSYRVENQALESVEFDVPNWLAVNDQLEISIDGIAIQGELLTTELLDGNTPSGRTRISLQLPRPELGEFALRLAYRLELSDLLPGNVTATSISLATPYGVEFSPTGSVASISGDEGIEVRLDDEQWVAKESGTQLESPLELSASDIPDRIDLLATHTEQSSTGATVVERLYLQTWIAGSERQDRAVFRIRTDGEALRFDLPRFADSEQLLAIVDGRAVKTTQETGGGISVPLPATASGGSPRPMRQHTVELGWRQAFRSGTWANLDWQPPKLAGAWVQQVRWHVIVPSNRLVLFPPEGMAADMTSMSWWRQRPSFSQRDLERWSGASAQPSIEAAQQTAGHRQYLFSTLGDAGAPSVAVTSIALVMLLVCGFTVAIIFLWRSVTVLRHPSILLAAGVLLIYLAIRWPDTAMLAAQVAVLAAAAIAASEILQRIILSRRAGRQRRQTIVANIGTGTRSTTRTREAINVPVAPSTTAKAGPSLPLTPSEVN